MNRRELLLGVSALPIAVVAGFGTSPAPLEMSDVYFAPVSVMDGEGHISGHARWAFVSTPTRQNGWVERVLLRGEDEWLGCSDFEYNGFWKQWTA